MHPRIDKLDSRISKAMAVWGHPIHRWFLGVFFLWFGLLKVFGHTTGSSLLAHTIYFGSPEEMVRVLGAWEALIGVCLLWPRLIRLGILLMAVRLPGTIAALVLKHDVCWVTPPFVPTPEGQYLIKDAMLLGAALVIGGEVRHDTHAARKRTTGRA
jgi:hypothetical protein